MNVKNNFGCAKVNGMRCELLRGDYFWNRSNLNKN